MNDIFLLQKANKDVDRLVDYVLQDIQETADNYDYQREWVIEKFREKFNKKVREML